MEDGRLPLIAFLKIQWKGRRKAAIDSPSEILSDYENLTGMDDGRLPLIALLKIYWKGRRKAATDNPFENLSEKKTLWKSDWKERQKSTMKPFWKSHPKERRKATIDSPSENLISKEEGKLPLTTFPKIYLKGKWKAAIESPRENLPERKMEGCFGNAGFLVVLLILWSQFSLTWTSFKIKDYFWHFLTLVYRMAFNKK